MPTHKSSARGIIGEHLEDGRPVITSFENELPPAQVREEYSWLGVIAWKYDGSETNGMPAAESLERMVALEEAIDERLVEKRVCVRVYGRTGNNLKELVYYLRDRDEFIGAFNEALSGHARYPIEINFYEDAEWKDFRVILDQFENAPDRTKE